MRTKSRQCGSALIESIPVLITLLVFLSGIFLAVYLLFARVWIQFQTEQSLICLAQGMGRNYCQSELHAKISEFLPWGTIQRLKLIDAREHWQGEVLWVVDSYRVRIDQVLTPKGILKRRGLP